MSASTVLEGKIPFTVHGETFETYYKIAGDPSTRDQIPIVVLHGGPGTAHNYMLPLLDLARSPQPYTVILYDQIGTGNSTRPSSQSTSFWTIDLFIAELENVLSYFSISNSFHILGHSWGATLASEFVVRRQPPGLKRLILSNALASAKLRNAAIARRRKSLPLDVQETLKTHEEAGTTQNQEYKAAMMVFHESFTCTQIRPLPAEILYAFEQVDAAHALVDVMSVFPYSTSSLGD